MRSTCLRLLALWLLFVLYGSFLPFDFVAVPGRDVLARLQPAHLDFRIDSHADFLANVLLMMPAGCFAAGACLQDRRGRPRRTVLTMAALGIAAAVFSAAVEITQLFLPARVMSPSDVVAETIGVLAGALGWLAGGDATRAALRRVRPTVRLDRGRRLLLGYVVFLLGWRLAPLDLTLDPVALHRKYLEGKVLVLTFTARHLVGVVVGCILIYMPVGVAAGLLWPSGGEGRRPGLAMALAALVVLIAECGRVFVLSAPADLTRLAPGLIGVSAGVWVAQRGAASASAGAAA